jgi:hypothetical protein
MSQRTEPPSDIVEISRINGDFKKNYGTLLGAFLYLRSLSAARGRSFLFVGLASALSIISAWFAKHGLVW